MAVSSELAHRGVDAAPLAPSLTYVRAKCSLAAVLQHVARLRGLGLLTGTTPGMARNSPSCSRVVETIPVRCVYRPEPATRRSMLLRRERPGVNFLLTFGSHPLCHRNAG